MLNPKPIRPEDRTLIRAMQAANTLLARVYHNLEVLAPLRVPRVGPAIVVCNHISTIDPMLIQSCCAYRCINWMMAKEYMDIPVLSHVFRQLEVIPVDRGSRETGPLRTALRRLGDGRVLGIFPEGYFTTTKKMLPFQTGVALMAIRAKVPIFPGYLDGTQRNKTMVQQFAQPATCVISFGPEVIFDRKDTSKENLEAATGAIKSAVEFLRMEVDSYRKKG